MEGYIMKKILKKLITLSVFLAAASLQVQANPTVDPCYFCGGSLFGVIGDSTPQPITILTCGHSFHSECIEPYHRQHQNPELCPICPHTIAVNVTQSRTISALARIDNDELSRIENITREADTTVNIQRRSRPMTQDMTRELTISSPTFHQHQFRTISPITADSPTPTMD